MSAPILQGSTERKVTHVKSQIRRKSAVSLQSQRLSVYFFKNQFIWESSVHFYTGKRTE